MTALQKIIKYFAITFAMVLIVAMISGAYSILNFIDIGDKSTVSKNLETIVQNITEVNQIDVALKYSNVVIDTGEEFCVQTNNKNIKVQQQGERVIIKDTSSSFNLTHSQKYTLKIYIPSHLKQLTVEVGAGQLAIHSLQCTRLNLNLGAGQTKIKNIIVTGDMNLDGGAGSIDIRQAKINSLDADIGAGAFYYQGILTGKSNIDSGVGTVRLDLEETMDQYCIKADKGLGTIKVNEHSLKDDEIYGHGTHLIEIDNGVGNVSIKTQR